MISKLLNLLIQIPHRFNVFLILPGIVVLVITDIILRSFFNSPIAWAHEVLGLGLLLAFFLEIPHCIQKRELLSVDLLYNQLPTMFKSVLDRLAALLIVSCAVLLCWQGYLGARDAIEYEDQAYTIAIPYWPFYVVIVYAGAVSLLQGMRLLFTRKIKTENEEQPS